MNLLSRKRGTNLVGFSFHGNDCIYRNHQHHHSNSGKHRRTQILITKEQKINKNQYYWCVMEWAYKPRHLCVGTYLPQEVKGQDNLQRCWPNHVDIGDEVHKTLCIYRHQIHNLSNSGCSSGSIGNDQGLDKIKENIINHYTTIIFFFFFN